MKRRIAIEVFAVAMFFTVGAMAQRTPGPRPEAKATPAGPHNWITPATSVERAGDAGLRAHTNYVLAATANGDVANLSENADANTPTVTHYETPSSMACIYKIKSNGNTPGCVPSFAAHTGGPQVGGWGTIAIVDAFDNPYAASEMTTFNTFWGLPAANFTKVYANGNGNCGVPPFNAGWGLEISLDIEWAHVMAPKANILLVEACSNSYTDLLYAEDVAASLVAAAGGGAVTNSWGGGEFAGETAYDVYFGIHYWQNVSYFASAGDAGCGAQYPSSSPWLTSAGGTTINRNATNLHFMNESCWSGSGGGISTQETFAPTWASGSNTGPWADYQYPTFGPAARHTPDFAFNADPNSGVLVYDCAYAGGSCSYWIVGGTSVSSPALAGIVNNAGNKLGTGVAGGYYAALENNLLYSQLETVLAYKKNFYDVKTGSNGCSVGVKWDYCTGVGSPRGLLGK